MELTKRTVLSFGKYKGRSIDDILENDPSYLRWMLKNVDGTFFSPDINTELALAEAYDGLNYFDVIN